VVVRQYMEIIAPLHRIVRRKVSIDGLRGFNAPLLALDLVNTHRWSVCADNMLSNWTSWPDIPYLYQVR
jgi:hypothetical protein